MRLTLRTLLAYLDDVLEPAEAQQLGERIGESEFATTLVQRIRDCMRREKLGAPRLAGKAAGLDPNTVSEYLDNTLGGERVVDFEKYCLESEVHLAETACCHQILALVLGEPAMVDPASRRRIYGLLGEYDAHAKDGKKQPVGKTTKGNGQPAATEAKPAGADEKPAPASPRRSAQVPDYLRDESGPTSVWWKIAAAVALAVLLVCVVIMAVGPMWSDRGGDGGPTVVDGGPVTPGDDSPVIPDLKKDEKKEPPVIGEKKIKIEVTPKIGLEKLPPPFESKDPLVKKDIPEKKATDGGPAKIATLTSLETMLLRFNSEAGNWARVPTLGAMGPGDQLLCLPACRNTLGLRGGVNLHVVGDTRLDLVQPQAAGASPGIRLHYGRLVLMTAGDPQSPLPLTAGNRQAKVTFANAGAVLAVEVRLVRPPGSDPGTVPARPVVDLVAVGNGSITWEEPDAQPLMIDAPGRHTLGLAEGEEPPAGMPEWIIAEQLTKTEELGVKALEQNLRGEAAGNVDESLLEWVVFRQWEVRTMAYRWLISIDKFDEAVAALNNADRHQSWAQIAEHLQFAIARGPQTADRVRAALERARGAEAAGLYRMLWGYSAADLKGGEAKRLVDHLEHEDLDYRVLSSWSLTDVTATPFNVFYKPHFARDFNERQVRIWRQKLELGQIVPKAKKAKTKP